MPNPTASEDVVEVIANAVIAEIARQTSSALGNTGHDDYQDMAIAGLDGEQGHITICRSELGRAVLASLAGQREKAERLAEAARRLLATLACDEPEESADVARLLGIENVDSFHETVEAVSTALLSFNKSATE